MVRLFFFNMMFVYDKIVNLNETSEKIKTTRVLADNKQKLAIP